MFKSFRTTLIVIILISAILPAVVVSFFLVNKIYNITRDAANKQLNLKAQGVSNELDHEIDMVITRLLNLSTNEDIVIATRKSPLGFMHFLGERAAEYFDDVISDNPLISALYLLDLDLNAAFSAPRMEKPSLSGEMKNAIRANLSSITNMEKKNVAMFEFKSPEMLSRMINTPEKDAVDHELLSEYVLVICIPVIHTITGEMKGALVTIIPIHTIAVFFAHRISNPTTLDILKNDSSILRRQVVSRSGGKKLVLRERMISSRIPLPIDTWNNRPSVNYTLELSEPYDLRFAKANETLNVLTLFLICVITFLLILSYSSARRLTRPIDKLLILLNDYAEGFRTVQEIKMRDQKIQFTEFKRVVDVLKEMESRIQNYIFELKQAEEKYSGLLERLNEAVFRVSLPEGDFEYFSQAAENVFGYPHSFFLENNLKSINILHPEDQDTFAGEWKKMMKSRVSPQFEYKIIDAQGNDRWIFQSNIGIFDERGKLTAVEGCCINITQRKQAEQELARTRIYLKNIIDSMPSILIGVDMDGTITEWNREAEMKLSIPENQAKNRYLTEVRPELSHHMDIVKQAAFNHTVKKIEKVKTMETFGMNYTDIVIFPLGGNGVEGAVIRIDDITERVRIEEMMVQTEKMMSVGGLAAGMAHEINNPLAGILQSAQVMFNRLSGRHRKNHEIAESCGISIEGLIQYMENRGIYKMLNGIMDSGKRAAEIVENMLSFSRAGDSRFTSQDIRQLLDKTVELAENDYDLKKKYDFRNIRIIREYDSDIPDIPCESAKIQQVFLNLLTNAAQAMSEHRRNSIEKARFILRITRRNHMVRIDIDDNGPGMPESVRKRVFEPFFTTKDVGVGTGLGLSVSYFIVTETHGGKMAVESEPGKGTRFTIMLPLAASDDVS